MKLGVLTSTGIRHRYFARRMDDAFGIAAVGYEETGYDPSSVRTAELTREEREIVAAHFAGREREEARFFGDRAGFLKEAAGRRVRRIAPGSLNTEETLRLLAEAGVDTVAVYGTNLIREPLLSAFAGRMVNLHLGLSPYYRGTATNFYPLLNEEPQYVGATIHLIDAGIDSGPILRHARPRIEAGDGPHTIGCKAIEAGIEAMIAVLRSFDSVRLRAVPQWPVPDAKLYLRKDYHPRQVVELYRKLETGLIERYVERAEERSAGLRLVE